MNPFFSILSACYIFGIFHWADSPSVQQIGVFNPYSLLHVPLYGILTGLLILAFSPAKGRIEARRLIGAGLAAMTVAVLDEVHQMFIPNRSASVLDVLLDGVGIGLVMGWMPRDSLQSLDHLRKRIRK